MKGTLAGFIFIMSMVAAWFTSIVNSVQDNDLIMLIASIFVPPVGVIHGIGVWFGWG